MVCWISARRSLQVVGCWVNIQKKIQVKPMITWTNFGKLFPLSVCPPVISRRIHLLWKNVHQHHTMLEIHIVVFVCWKSQKHHGFCLGGKWDPYRFPGISWGESKGQKDDLKAETGPVRGDVFKIIQKKTYRIYRCVLVSKICVEENLHPTKKNEKNMCFTHFLTAEFWR